RAEDGIRDFHVTGVQTCALPIFDDMIAKNEDTVILDLCRQMPVADMPGEFGYVERVAPADFVEFLACSADFNFAPVVQNEPVSRSEERRVGKECGTARNRYESQG